MAFLAIMVYRSHEEKARLFELVVWKLRIRVELNGFVKVPWWWLL